MCLPAMAWLEAAAALEKCEMWARCLRPDGEEGKVRAGLERLYECAWAELGDLMPVTLQLAEQSKQLARNTG
jgi:hypothetical protein